MFLLPWKMNRYGLRFFFRWWAGEIIRGVWTLAEPITFRLRTLTKIDEELTRNTVCHELHHARFEFPLWSDVQWIDVETCWKVAKFRKLAKLIRDPVESLVENLSKDGVDQAKARTSLENATSRFCNHFTCKMCSNHPGIKLEPAPQR